MDSAIPSAVARAAALLEKQPLSWTRAAGGYTPADRFVVRFADGTSCFAKMGTNAHTVEGLRREYHVYSHLSAPFLPRMLGWEDGEGPLLVLDDLSEATWPPPWSREQVDAVLDALSQIRVASLLDVPSVADEPELEGGSWVSLAGAPEAFLSLRLCSEQWLRNALPLLIEYEAKGAALAPQGDALLHIDVRSDNICFVDGRALLIDWNWAATGHPEVDIAGWLPSLHSEGGPLPDELLPDAPHWAAWIAGFFASRAGLPVIPNAPRVRQVQLSQLESALPWAQRALGLPPLDGPKV